MSGSREGFRLDGTLTKARLVFAPTPDMGEGAVLASAEAA